MLPEERTAVLVLGQPRGSQRGPTRWVALLVHQSQRRNHEHPGQETDSSAVHARRPDACGCREAGVEPVGVGERGRVVVGCTEVEDHQLPGGDVDITDLQVLAGAVVLYSARLTGAKEEPVEAACPAPSQRPALSGIDDMG